MNKKFLSAILFGAMMATSAGTFVSCKDYDDDIDELNTRVDGVEGQLKDLESKINAAKWITSVTPTEGGFTVSFSDGSNYTITNGKNGADGVNGADGTEWTISEDGFWVCNGEKTTVKAVGIDGAKGEQGEAGKPGENGKDAQPEVKKENGKWYLWNGTEFEAFECETAPAVNVPYYFTDPTDANYTILVVCDKDGKNEKQIRLPMNEGLAQINLLSKDVFSNYYIYCHRYNGTAEWNGSKALPAKGEYIITQNKSSFLVQVTPANYDLAALDLKLVNAKGEEAPVVLGKPTPYAGSLIVQSRSVSKTGIFEITVAPKDFKKETIETFAESFNGQGLSLVANESVRSKYCVGFNVSEPYNVPTISWDRRRIESFNSASLGDYDQDLNDSNEMTLTATYDNGDSADRYIYDAYVTLNPSCKADSIKAGVEIEGLKVTAKEPCNLKVNVHYVNAMGQVKKQEDIRLCFYKSTPAAEIENFALAATTHKVEVDAKKQNQLVDLAAYFNKYASDEASRILWNADARLVAGGQVEIDGNTGYGVKAVMEYEDEYGDVKTRRIDNSVASIVLADKDGKEVEKSKATHLKVTFAENYNNVFNGCVKDFEKAKVTVYATVYMENEPAQTIAIPVTLKNPTAEDLAATYAFNASFNLNNVITVYGDKITKENIFSKGASNITYVAAKADADKINVASNGDITLKTAGERNKVYTLNAKINYAGLDFTIADFKVKFANSKTYTAVMPSAISIISGSGNAVVVKYGKVTGKDDKNIYYRVDNIVSSTEVAAGNVTVTAAVEEAYADFLTATVDGDDITLTAKAGDAYKVAVETTVKVVLTITVDEEEIKDTIVVKLTPYPAQ